MEAKLYVVVYEWEEGDCICLEVETAQDGALSAKDKGIDKQDFLELLESATDDADERDMKARISMSIEDDNVGKIASWIDETLFIECEQWQAIDDSVIVWRYNDESCL